MYKLFVLDRNTWYHITVSKLFLLDRNQRLTKRLEKKLDGSYSKMLRVIFNKSWRQHPTKQQLYGHLPTITKTIQIRRTRYAGHCWWSRGEIISDVLLWTPSHGRAIAGRPGRTHIQQLCEDTGCSSEDLPEAMNDRGVAREGQGYLCWWHDKMMRWDRNTWYQITVYKLFVLDKNTWYQITVC